MRINKKYKSLEELNHDILLMKLQTNITKEEIRLIALKARHDFKPLEMTTEYLDVFVRQKLKARVISAALNWIQSFRYFRNRQRNNY